MIDHLPRNSWYSQAVANDEEHAQMLADAQAALPKSDETEDTGTPMVGYSYEREAIEILINEFRQFNANYAAVNSKEGTPRVQPKFMTGPRTALQRAVAGAERARKKAKHEALVARVLPRKRKKSGDDL